MPRDGAIIFADLIEQNRISVDRRGFEGLLDSGPDPVVAEKVADLRSMFKDAYTGWLEVEQEAA
jgi:hypothetical protein